MSKVYRIFLTSFDGDEEEKLIDQEAWDWITSPDPGNRNGPNDDEYGWVDALVPQVVKDNWISWYDEEYSDIKLTSGSWENDRALHCPSDPNIPKGSEYVDTFHGYIY